MDLADLGPRLERAADRVGPEVNRTVQQQARLARAMIRWNASGRPGPNIISGDYFDSWGPAQPFAVPDGGGAMLGTDRPQARRLEYGFMERYDVLGRYYEQPPFPHVEPAVNELSEEYVDAFKDACARIFEGA